MVELEQRIEELKKIKDPGEDLEVCQEELSGLEDLVLEDAQNLHRRVVPGPQDLQQIRRRQAQTLRRQPAPGRLHRQEIPQPRPVVPGHHPGRQHRPDARGR